MIVVLAVFSLFHVCVGAASLGLAIRLLSQEERAHWRSKSALFVAEVLCWVYPVLALAAVGFAWRAFLDGAAHAMPLMLAPIGWLIVMGLVFAIVDFAEDGVLGNARSRIP